MSQDVQVEPPSEDYDPFHVFDTSTGAGAVRDPWPTFARLRESSPVYEGILSEAFGVPNFESAMISAGSRQYAALSYDAVSQLLLDPETFSSTGYAKAMDLVMGHSILAMDPPEHRRYRNVLQQAFTLKAMERWENEIVRPIVERRIDAFAAHGRADLVHELTFPFPLEVISAMMGLPEDDLPKFHRLAVELISIAVDIERGLVASQKLRDYFAEVLAARRQAPRDDLISMLAQGELEDGERLTDEDIFAFLRLLLPAGAETTYRSSSNLLCGLLNDPAQLEALRADRSLMRQSIEEGLRWEPPLTSIARNVLRDTELCGVPIPRDAIVTVCMGSANHDPARWEDPDRFDVFRPQKPHISFATGPHTCLGLHLARMETAVALNALFDRLPGLRLDPDAEDVHITGLTFRGPRALPVVFDT